ncbi:NAD(+) synthase [Candidatus Woesearchaeota archaeon]|nr:NAD(+) synthase [Candidatus Woesearchaeota archaeon]
MKQTLEKRIKKAKMNPAVVSREIENFILEQMTGFNRFYNLKGGVIGLSGGIDSTTVAYLAKKAFDRYNNENPDKEQLTLYGLIMPAKANNGKDQRDGERVANLLGIEYKIIEIEPVLQARESINDIFKNSFHKGNAASRERMIQLYAEASARKSLVLGTGNYDEDYCIGYFTKFGDGGVDCNPIGNLPKRLVRELAQYMGVPMDLVSRTPTAGLWDGQTDENELGYTYNHVETVMNGFAQGFTEKEIIEITGYEPSIVEDIQKRHDGTEHKRILPPVPKISLRYE